MSSLLSGYRRAPHQIATQIKQAPHNQQSNTGDTRDPALPYQTTSTDWITFSVHNPRGPLPEFLHHRIFYSQYRASYFDLKSVYLLYACVIINKGSYDLFRQKNVYRYSFCRSSQIKMWNNICWAWVSRFGLVKCRVRSNSGTGVLKKSDWWWETFAKRIKLIKKIKSV